MTVSVWSHLLAVTFQLQLEFQPAFSTQAASDQILEKSKSETVFHLFKSQEMQKNSPKPYLMIGEIAKLSYMQDLRNKFTSQLLDSIILQESKCKRNGKGVCRQ